MKHPVLKSGTLAVALIAANQAMAGGFDNSSRGFDIIYGDDNVISTSYGVSKVPMKAQIVRMQRAENSGAEPTSAKTIASGNILDDFTRPQVGIRYNVNEQISCGAQIEKPFAAGVAYADDEIAYVVTNDQGMPINSNGDVDTDNPATKTAPITTQYNSDSFTFACGYDFALPKGQLKVFGGPKLQKVSGSFDEDLSPLDLGANDNLDVTLDGGYETGFIAGVAYSIPEIALRASLLYHSQIDYKASGTLTAVLPEIASLSIAQGTPFKTDATASTFTPQTVELALQSGIAENTLAFLKMRWSEYGKLAELQVYGDGNTEIAGSQNPYNGNNPVTLGQLAQLDEGANSLINPNVSMFSNDTFDYSFGLGRRFNDQLTMGASFSGSIKLGGKSDDTPIGADATSLRLPGDTTHTIAFGGEYAVLPELKLNGGLGFSFIDEYRVETTSSSYRAEFEKTEAISFQMGLSYQL